MASKPHAPKPRKSSRTPGSAKTAETHQIVEKLGANFFAETEQVAFLPTNVPPGIDFSNDPLLQGRFLSYQDTQLSRLGGPNFHQIPVNVPRENPTRGFASYPEEMEGTKVRKRSDTFADHYSQARLFFRSMTKPEQMHIVSAFAFELGKVETIAIRTRMLGHLANVDADLHAQVADALGMKGQADKIAPAVPPRDLAPSPALSIIGKAPVTLG